MEGRPDFDILEQILVKKIKLTESEKLKGWQVDELQGSNQAGKLSEDFLLMICAILALIYNFNKALVFVVL